MHEICKDIPSMTANMCTQEIKSNSDLYLIGKGGSFADRILINVNLKLHMMLLFKKQIEDSLLRSTIINSPSSFGLVLFWARFGQILRVSPSGGLINVFPQQQFTLSYTG